MLKSLDHRKKEFQVLESRFLEARTCKLRSQFLMTKGGVSTVHCPVILLLTSIS